MCTVAAILLAATVHVAFAVYMIAVRQSSLSNTHTASWRHGFLRGHSNSNITHPTTTQYLLAGTHIQCRSIINTLSTAPWVIISLISLKDVQSEERRWKEWGVEVKKNKTFLWRRLNTGNLIKILHRLVKSAQGFAAPYESGRLHPKLEENDSDDALWPQPRASGNVGTRTSRFRWVQTSEPHTKLHFYL